MTKRKSLDRNTPIWFDGTNINEALFCDEFLSSRKIIFANGAFFTPDGRVTDDLPLRGEIYEELKCCAVNNIPRKITNILEVMKLAAHVEVFAPEADRIHLANGTLALDGSFTEGRPSIVRSRLPVAYRPDAPAPVRWLSFLDGLLYAEDIPTLGNDKVWRNVNHNNVQALLDGEYGSINDTTIELSAGDYRKIEFGRATAYEGSDTKYYLSGAISDLYTIKKDIDDHPNGGAAKREYVRSINGLVAFGGQVNSNKWYSKDFVANRDMSETVNNNISYWVVQNWSNITFEGLNFTSAVNIESSETRTSVNGLHFKSCSFNSGYPTTTSDNAGGMGIRFVSWTTTTDNLKNLTVNNCKFENCSDGVSIIMLLLFRMIVLLLSITAVL